MGSEKELGATYGHAALLHGLAQHLEDGALELRQLVEEEHPVVGQRYLARLGVYPAADQGNIRDGVMWGTERAHGYQRVLLVHESRHRMYLGGLEAFAERQRRQDARHAFGEHGLAAARGAYHDGVVAAGGSNLEASLNGLLPLDVGEVIFVAVERAGELGAGVHDGLFKRALAVEEINDLLQRVGAVDLEVVDDGGLAGVLGGHYDAFVLLFSCLDGYGQHTFDGAQRAVEAQLSHDDVFVEVVSLHVAQRPESCNSDGEVVSGAFFFQVGRC